MIIKTRFIPCEGYHPLAIVRDRATILNLVRHLRKENAKIARMACMFLSVNTWVSHVCSLCMHVYSSLEAFDIGGFAAIGVAVLLAVAVTKTVEAWRIERAARRT